MSNPSVDFVMTIYQESSPRDLELLVKALNGMLSQTYPNIKYWIIYDAATPRELLDFIKDNTLFDHEINWFQRSKVPIEFGFRSYLEGVIEFIRLISVADYVCITHSDDESFPTRVADQLKSFEQYPDAVLSFAGFMFNDGKSPEHEGHLILDWESGFNVGYPSGWMLDRKYFKDNSIRLPIIKYKDDVEYLLNILTAQPIIAMKKPLFRYNYLRCIQITHPEEDAHAWKCYRQYYQAVRHRLKSVYMVIPSLRLMMLGWFADGYESTFYAEELEKLGIEIIRVSTDANPKAIFTISVNEQIMASYQNPKQIFDIQSFQLLHPIADIVNKYKPDAILIQQNDLPIDLADVTVPWFYLMHEIIWKRWIYNSKGISIPKGIFYAYLGAPAYYENTHTYEMHHIPNSRRDYLPYAWSPNQYFPMTIDKHHFIGFMGDVGEDHRFGENPDADYLEWHIRDLRARFIPYLQKYHGCIVMNKGTHAEYNRFMNECMLFVNITAIAGFVNQRMFHAPAVGCVLLQNRFVGLDDLGLRDFENCLLFSDETELDYKIDWAHKNADELRQIRKNGMVWAQAHTYAERAKDLITHLQTWLGEP